MGTEKFAIVMGLGPMINRTISFWPSLEPSQASTKTLTISKAFFVVGQPFLDDLHGDCPCNELDKMKSTQINPR